MPKTFSRQTDTGGYPDLQLYTKLRTCLVNLGVCPHHDVADDAALVTAADATDLATSKTLTLDITNKLYAGGTAGHNADTDLHDATDSTALPAAFTSYPSEPADLAEVGATLNEIKTDFNAHLIDTTSHANGIGGEAALTLAQITTANFASTQGEANTLANALKAAINLHVKMGLPAVSD